MTHPIVVVGSLTDTHALAVYEALRERGHEPVVLDAQRFPESLHLSLGERPGSFNLDGRRIARPAAVYVRSLYQSPAGFGVDADADMQADWRRTMMAYRERSTLLSAVLLRWEQAGVPLYNPPGASARVTKPFQLSLLAGAGLPVPRSLWTNDPEAVRRFADELGACIYKPVAGGAATHRLEAKDLTPERLASLSGAPVCFQELLPGHDVRVYVVDGRVVCALRIETEAIDFRQHEQSVTAIELDAEVAEQCVRAAALIGLRYTGMDIKADREGRYRILELNPSAMFLGFEHRAKVDIRGPLVEALIAHADARDPGRM